MRRPMTQWERAYLEPVKPFCDMMRDGCKATGVSLKHLMAAEGPWRGWALPYQRRGAFGRVGASGR